MNWVIFFSCLIVLLLFGRSERSKSFICSNPNCDFSGKIVAKRELIPSSSKEIGLSRSEGLIITLWVWECPMWNRVEKIQKKCWRTHADFVPRDGIFNSLDEY